MFVVCVTVLEKGSHIDRDCVIEYVFCIQLAQQARSFEKATWRIHSAVSWPHLRCLKQQLCGCWFFTLFILPFFVRIERLNSRMIEIRAQFYGSHRERRKCLFEIEFQRNIDMAMQGKRKFRDMVQDFVTENDMGVWIKWRWKFMPIFMCGFLNLRGFPTVFGIYAVVTIRLVSL